MNVARDSRTSSSSGTGRWRLRNATMVVIEARPAAGPLHTGEPAPGRPGLHPAAAAEPDHKSDGDGAEDVHGGVVERVGQDGVLERVHVPAVHGGEVAEGTGFAIEELHHAHAADMFLGKAIDARDGSGGLIDSVTDEEILTAYRLVAAKEGVFVEPSSAAGIAGLFKKQSQGQLPKGKKIVITVTGNGLKDVQWILDGAASPTVIPVDIKMAAAAMGLL